MSNETQTAASPAAEPTAAPATATPPAATSAPSATPPAAPPADPAQAPAAAPAAAPQGEESYDLTAPEGSQFDDETLGELKALAKESKMPKEQAQKLADLGVKAVQKYHERMTAQYEQQQQQWVNDSRADKEFGGDKLNQNLAVAKRALDTFGTPELTKLLNESGLGNHPEVIRYNFRVAQALSEDRVVPGSVKPSAPNAQSFYAKSQMNP